MGYRSQVVLAISKHLTPFLTLAASQNTEAQSLVFKHADTFDRDYGGDKSWLMVWDGIKWYDSYEDIQAIEKFVQEACADEYEFEIEGKAELFLDSRTEAVQEIAVELKRISDIEIEIKLVIQELKSRLVTQKELDRIKAQVLASEVYQQDSIDYQARILGMIKTSVGDTRIIKKYTANINSVTAEQVRKVAKKYLVSNLKTSVKVNDTLTK
jgi:hypothetical protein